MNASDRRPMIIPPTSGTSSKNGFTPSSWRSSKRCSRSATDTSACAGARRKAVPTPKTPPSSMDSMKPGQSYTQKKRMASRKLARPFSGVTDSKIIKLFVDDEPFWLPNANLLSYDRRLNMRSGTLDREILWETPAGKQVLITSRRLISFANRHVAAISYRVTLLNAAASPSQLFQRPSHRAVPCDRKEPFDPDMCHGQCDRDLMSARLQGRPYRGLWPGCLHDLGPSRLSNPAHQIHVLSYLPYGLGIVTLRPPRID